MDGPAGHRSSLVDSRYAWLRLGMALLLGTVGSVGMWSYVVALPAVQADFAATRADASIPYTMAMVGFAVGNMILGRLADRFGIVDADPAQHCLARHRLCQRGLRADLVASVRLRIS